MSMTASVRRGRFSRRVALTVAVFCAGGSVAVSGEPGSRDPLSADPRLSLPLTVSAPSVSLRELLPRFARVIGVGLSVAPEVAEQKVVIFGEAQPARATLGNLAALLDLEWSPTHAAGDRPEFRLHRSPRAARRLALLEREAIDRVQELVDQHARALSETPEQLSRRDERDVTRILLSDPEWRPTTVLYALLSEPQKKALFTRKEIRLALASLTRQQQEPLRLAYARRVEQEEAFFSSSEGQEAIRKAGPNGHPIRHRPEDLERNAFRIQSLRTDGHISVGMNLGSGPTTSSITVDDEGRTSYALNGWPITLVDTRQCWTLPPHGNPYGAPDDRSSFDRFAEAAAKVNPKAAWVDRLRALAEAAQKPVLADYYRGPFCSLAPKDALDSNPVRANEQKLDRFCAEAQYLWWVRGDALLLRKRDWVTQDAYEAPDEWLTRHTARLAARKGAHTSDLAQLAELSAAQIDGLAALARGGWTNDSSESEAVRSVLSLVAPQLRLRDQPIPGEGQPYVLTLSNLAPNRRREVVRLGESLGWILTPEDLPAFRVRVSAGPRMETAVSGCVPVYVECECGPGHQMRSLVYLPLQAPDDRRNQVLVERAK